MGMSTDELLAEIENVGSYNDMLEMPLTFIMLKRLARIVRAADMLATHVDGLLDLRATSVPETTKRWLNNYRKARDGDESTA